MRTFLILALLFSFACDSKKAAPQAPDGQKATNSKSDDSTSDDSTSEADAPDPSSPAGVVNAYYAAVKADEMKRAYGLVSADDRAARPFEQFQTVAADPTQKVLNAERTFTAGKSRIEGDTARVNVKVEGPDVPLMQRKLLAEYVNEGDKVPPPDELKVILREKMSAPDAPQATSEVEVILVKEEGAWRLDFDWDEAHPDRAVPQKEREAAED